jgi:hypothetical protein
MKILVTIITDDLSWDENTNELIKKVNKRMLLIKKIHSFEASTNEMVELWISYCRSVLEQSAVVWSSSLTDQNKKDLERTQKSFTKLILKNKYTDYESSLLQLNLQSLEERRQYLSLKFANNCLKNPKFRTMFKENTQQNITRSRDKYKIPFCHTEQMRKSAIIQMTHQLNTLDREDT